MARKTNPNDIPPDFDDLLNASITPGIDEPISGIGPEDPGEIELEELEPPDEVRGYDSENEESAELTPDQLRIIQLEAELAKPIRTRQPAPIEEKTPDQLRIEELEQKLAERNAAALDTAPETYVRATGSNDVLIIHFIEDGFSDLNNVWLRGQEIYVDESIREMTVDRFGNSWLDDLSIEAQYRRWGRQYIGIGKFIPRPGEVFTDEVAREDVRRRGAIPVLAE